MTVSEILIERIAKNGPVSFRDFMETCLYHPGAGYYTSPGEKIGKNGDYYTSPVVSEIFGELICKQLEEMWRLLGEKTFSIIEYGAGTGALCHDILRHAKKNPAFYDKIRYCIIEKSETMRIREQSLLPEKVNWYSSIAGIPHCQGCILSNELLDNFSVHQVIMEDILKEVFVDYRQGFTEVLKPASAQLNDYFTGLGVSLPAGFRTEVNLQAIDWLSEIAATFQKGFVLTIDYGQSSARLYQSSRQNGTLLCYYRHSLHEDPYIHVGEQDITAHVNFSALHHWGLKHGLALCGFVNQANFLSGLGLAAHIRNKELETADRFQDTAENNFMIHTLMAEMGVKMKVMIQQKGMEKCFLSGMQFSLGKAGL